MTRTATPAARCGKGKAHGSCLRKLFGQRAQAARLQGARSRWHALIDDSGASLVEFALSACVLLALLLGVLFLCFALYTRHFVSEAALEGARWAMVRGSTSCTNTPSLTDCNATSAEIQTYVQSLSYPGINSQSLTASTSWCSVSTSTPASWSSCSSTTANSPGNAVQVVVTYPFALQIPLLNVHTLSFSSSSLTFSSTAQLVISQ